MNPQIEIKYSPANLINSDDMEVGQVGVVVDKSCCWSGAKVVKAASGVLMVIGDGEQMIGSKLYSKYVVELLGENKKPPKMFTPRELECGKFGVDMSGHLYLRTHVDNVPGLVSFVSHKVFTSDAVLDNSGIYPLNGTVTITQHG